VSDDRIFIYLRLQAGEQVLKRSKIREFAGLGTLLADFRRELVGSGDPLPGLRAGVLPALEYVDADSDEVLISFQVDPGAGEQVISGRIPAAYRPRMLDPQHATFSTDRFVARAAPELDEAQRQDYARRLARSGQDVMTRIREAIDAEGHFELHLPLA
jgi:hypothetical protein